MAPARLATIVATGAAFAVDALGLVHKSAPGSPLGHRLWVALQAMAFLLPWAALLGFGLCAALEVGRRALCPRRPVVVLGDGARALDLVVALSAVLSGWALGVFVGLVEAWMRFNNKQLAALLVVSGALLLLLLAIPFALVIAAGLRRARERGVWAYRAVAALSLVLGAAAWGQLALLNRSGFRQLDGWLFASVTAFVAAFAITWRLRCGNGSGPRVRVMLGAIGVALVVVSGVAVVPWSVVPVIAAHGSVGRYLVLALRTLTDVDRDGYSSLWMGGDCRPFDPAVHPGQVEIIGDGIDNNCLGGDATEAEVASVPEWHSIPAGTVADANLVLITVETLRADRVSHLGYRRTTTPNWDQLAQRCFVFEHFYASTPWTRLSLPALLSSRPATRIAWEKRTGVRGRVIGAGTPWIPTLLAEAGFSTVAVLNGFNAFTAQDSLGLDRGFQTYDVSTKVAYTGGTMRGFPGREQAVIVDREFARLGEKRFFLWLHLMEPHYQYERSPRAPDFGDEDQDLYDSEVWETDAVIGEVQASLRRHGLADRTMLVITGDHGEEFGEHGQRWHGSNLYEPQLRTPATLCVPGLRGTRLPGAANHEDLGPTVLNLLGVQAGFETLSGRNLVPWLVGQRVERGYFFLERFNFMDGSKLSAAIVHHPYKLIYTRDGEQLEFYDVALDPSERRPLARQGEPYQSLEKRLLQHVEGAGQ